MVFAKFVTETSKHLFPSGSSKYEFENFRHTGPLQSDWSKSVLAPPLSIPKCLPFFHAKSMGLAILSLYYRWPDSSYVALFHDQEGSVLVPNCVMLTNS